MTAHGEGKIATPRTAQGLQHCQQATGPGFGRQFQQAPQAGGRLIVGQHALELVEAAFTVDAIPIADGIERIEEILPRDNAVAASRRNARQPGGVEALADQPQRQEIGRRQRQSTDASRFASQRRIGCLANLQHRATQRLAARHGIDPGDAVGDIWPVRRQRRQQRIEIGQLAFAHRDGGLRVGLQFDGNLQDDAGQSHAANGGGEQGGRGDGVDAANIAVGSQQVEPLHMIAKTASAIMVLAMDVGSNSAANADPAGAGDDGQAEAARHEQPVDLGQTRAGLADQNAIGGIEIQQPIQPRHVDNAATFDLRRIAIGATEAARQQRAFGLVEKLRQLAATLWPRQMRQRMAHPAKAAQRPQWQGFSHGTARPAWLSSRPPSTK